MYLEKIFISNFRNLSCIEIFPSKNLNVLYGNNAQGKTNILEAIYTLAFLKSFRGAKNDELILHAAEFSSIKATFVANKVRRKVNLTIEKKSKQVTIDNKKPQSSSEFFGVLKPILFFPDEIHILKGPPSGKRLLLDRAVFQTSPIYLNRVLEYNRFLKQRNKNLKEGKSNHPHDPWTEGLVSAGTYLRLERNNYLGRIIPLLREVYKHIAGDQEHPDICYPLLHQSEEQLAENFKLDLRRTAERENYFGQTLVGPHRDHIDFFINGFSLRQYGSQGQQRSFLLAFKIAQIIDIDKGNVAETVSYGENI
ncbi:MAG: DNA replication and repair protein RecF [Desulfuromonadaceae bacterium]